MAESHYGSPYAKDGPTFVDCGYSAIPIRPGSKCPGTMHHGVWFPMSDWTKYADRLPTHYELQLWNTYPDAGVGLVCGGPAGGHVVGVDVDTDDRAISSAILRVVPTSTVIKRGQKGDTRFYRGASITTSPSWSINKKRVCDFIGPGRQTLLPPTLHPDTGNSYVWLTDDTLLHVRPEELPEITPDHIAAIGEALKAYGWKPEPEWPPRLVGGESDAGTPWGILNDEALANLDKWVPALGLYRWRRKRAAMKLSLHGAPATKAIRWNSES